MKLNKIFETKVENSTVLVKFVNVGEEIDDISYEDLNSFFKYLAEYHINGFSVTFEKGEEPTQENGDSLEKAFAYEFAKSFEAEWENSIENLNNIKNAKEEIAKIVETDGNE